MRDPVDEIFVALADPSRRFVIATLAARETATPTELAAHLPVTRQAVTKHLVALRAAGLVEATRRGRETRYALTPEPLAAAAQWIEEVGAAWDERLAALKRLVEAPVQRTPPRPSSDRIPERRRPAEGPGAPGRGAPAA